MNSINIKLVRPGAKLPHRATPTSGAFDCYAPEAGFINVGERKQVFLGFAHDISANLDMIPTSALWGTPNRHQVYQLQGLLISRSGLANRHGVKLFFDPCLIDHDYRGEISAILTNLGTNTYHWQQHERLCQIAYVPFFMGGLTLTDTLTTTDRGEGGFGSTGK
jgi:dUTP pyrophosphatase